MCKAAAEALIRVFLVVINLMFGAIGALMIACGGIILGGSELIQDEMKDILEAIPHLNSIVEGVQSTMATPLFDMSQALQNAAIAFIVIGGILFIISFLGCVAGCCATKVVIIIYLVITCLLFVVQLVMVALFFVGVLDNIMIDLLDKGLNEEYKGVDADDPVSVMINYMQLEMKCCGVDGGWNYNQTEWYKAKAEAPDGKDYIVPITCCVMNGTFPNVVPLDPQCPQKVTTTNSYYYNGCWDGLVNFVQDYAVEAVVVVAVTLGVQLFLILMVGCLMCIKRDSDD